MGTLSIVATPIGNLEDFTFRALRILSECEVVYAEDTRVVAKLLRHYKIKKPVARLDAVTEAKRAPEVVRRLEAGEKVVYVSDAGTPGISDPGARLVASVRELLPEATIETIPGPSSLTAALAISGVDSTAFTFLGFLPHKKGRQTILSQIVHNSVPVVLFESPHRILKLLTELQERDIAQVVVARELTKLHEEVHTGTPLELLAHYTAHSSTVRGEFVIIVTP